MWTILHEGSTNILDCIYWNGDVELETNINDRDNNFVPTYTYNLVIRRAVAKLKEHQS